LRAVLAAAGLLAAGAGFAAADTDLAWIGKLPGVSPRPGQTAGPKTVYALSKDVDATMASVREGLVQRRWTFVKPAPPAGKAAPVRTLIAEKEGTRVKVVGGPAKGASTLTVTVVRGLGTSGETR
jgi:hypothetical protein